MKEGIIIYILLFCIAASCDSIQFSELPDYPVTIEPMGLLALDALNDEYQTVNDFEICSTLNEYGLTGYSRILFPNDIDPCIARGLLKEVVEYPDSLVIEARKIVEKNAKYTNVYDSENLEVEEFLPIYGCTICEGPNQNSVPLEWKITFANQVLDRLEVYDTQITVFVNAQGVTELWGNWYKDFFAPDLLDVGYVEAKSKVVDTSLLNNDGSGSIIVTDDMLIGNPVLKIVPYKNDEGMIEMRKVWTILIDYDLDHVAEFTAFVDVVDGLLLTILDHSIN